MVGLEHDRAALERMGTISLVDLYKNMFLTGQDVTEYEQLELVVNVLQGRDVDELAGGLAHLQYHKIMAVDADVLVAVDKLDRAIQQYGGRVL
jgi:hypothetical protein